MKDKRRVIKSILERLRHRYNVSIAEVGQLDTWRRAVIGFAFVSNETAHLGRQIQKIIDHVESDGRVELEEIKKEIVKIGS